MVENLALDRAPIAMRDCLAFDRGSVRTTDHDGRLHVAISRITKANICPYRGAEIPGCDQLGLSPDRIYNLYRDPAELEKSVATWNNLPLLSCHAPTSADEPQKDLVVGSTGTDAAFTSPYLTNSLVIWDGEAIAGIETEEQKELSCGYRYVPDMTPGEVDGEQYDGVMRSIVGNHIAIVEEGRAGKDIVIGDTQVQLKETPIMKTKALRSRKALLVQGALAAHLTDKLAVDASLDFSPILADVTRANYATKKAGIAKGVEKALKGKLANDEGLGAVVESVVELLDKLGGVDNGNLDEDGIAPDVAEEGEKMPFESEEDKAKRAPKAGALDADAPGTPMEHLNALRGHIPDNMHDALAEHLQGRTAEDEDPEPGEKPEDNGMVDRPAMDAAIRRAKDETRRDTIRHFNAIADAKRAVEPYVGELSGAFDSAEAVYKLALDNAIDNGATIDLTHVPPVAYGAMVKMLPIPGTEAKPARLLAQDGKGHRAFAAMFPGLASTKKL